MGRASVPSKYCLTILRLPVQEATREQVFNSPQWFDVLEAILRYSNWRFTFVAQEVNSTKLDVFIGWKFNTDPPVIFTEQDSSGLDSLLSPLQYSCSPDKPQVINLFSLAEKMGCYDLRVEKIKSEDRIIEALTVHGPAEIMERNILEIKEVLTGYINQRRISIGMANYRYRKHALKARPLLFRELQTSTPESAIGVTLFIERYDQEGRSNFHDPKVPDLQIPRSARKYLRSDFWETRVAPRLKELADQGASVISWDCERAKIAVGRDGHVTTLRRDKIW